MPSLRKRRVRFDDLVRLRIDHLLIVAGPSASGKSTFLKCLAEGNLPADLLAALPGGAGRWPQTSGVWIEGEALATPSGSGDTVLSGVVMHYDLLRPFDKFEVYELDPSLAFVKQARRITAVILRPTRDALLRQIGAKASDNPTGRRILRHARRLVRVALNPEMRIIPATGERASWRALIFPRRELIERHTSLQVLYGTPGFLENWYERWSGFLDRTGKSEAGDRIAVEPFADAVGRPSFRLLRT